MRIFKFGILKLFFYITVPTVLDPILALNPSMPCFHPPLGQLVNGAAFQPSLIFTTEWHVTLFK